MPARLKIETVKLNDLKPYENNSKEHPHEQIEQIKKSIQDFGFNDPIAIYGPDNLIVEGHGRYLACQELGIDTVPVIRLDHLTDEQRRAYTLVHNQLTMNSGFDIETLNLELSDISFDMSVYGFEIPDIFEDEFAEGAGIKDDAGERTTNKMNLQDFDEERCFGPFQIPTLKKCDYVPKHGLMKFDNIMTAKSHGRYEEGIHFFMHDVRFERFWDSPLFYIEKLSQYDCVLTPDFSVYMDMPMAMKIWNVYRSRLLGQMMQDYGIKVIPTLIWAEPETYDLCFGGIEPGGSVAVSTVGVMRGEESQKVWQDGIAVAIERLKPKNIILYGYKKIPEFDPKGANVIHIMADRFDV